jgi:hypothetical protein
MPKLPDRKTLLSVMIIASVVIMFESWSIGKRIYNQLESDPLTIVSTSTNIQTVGCGGVVYLARHITTTKALKVEVTRQFMAISGPQQGTIYDIGKVTYEEHGAVNKYLSYSLKTPKQLPDGIYLYTPILKYHVNEDLVINRPSPSQVFRVDNKGQCYE